MAGVCRRGKKMSLLLIIFGEGRDLDSLQMSARAVAVFFSGLVFIRIAGRRSFGQRSPFDYVVAILLGATLSRVIVGASPAIPTVAASLVIVLVHRILAWGCVYSPKLERLIVGAERGLQRWQVRRQANVGCAHHEDRCVRDSETRTPYNGT